MYFVFLVKVAMLQEKIQEKENNLKDVSVKLQEAKQSCILLEESASRNAGNICISLYLIFLSSFIFTHVSFSDTSEITSECYTGPGGTWGKTQGDGATQMGDWGLCLLIQLFWTYLKD